jgi:hypothetical protein
VEYSQSAIRLYHLFIEKSGESRNREQGNKTLKARYFTRIHSGKRGGESPEGADMSLTELIALAFFIAFTYFFLLVFIQDALNKVRFEIEEMRKTIEECKRD